MLNRMVVGLIGLLMVSQGVMAHEGEQHQSLLGTVERARECHMVVRTGKGEIRTIFFAPDTRYERGAQAATKQDLKAGARVSVEVESDGETASVIKIGGAQ